MTAALKAGELDRRIRVVRPSYTQDSTGDPVATETVIGEAWAKKMEQRLSEVFSGASDQALGRIVFRIRYRPDVQQSDNVIYSGERYEIIGIQEYGRRVGLDIICQRLGGNI